MKKLLLCFVSLLFLTFSVSPAFAEEAATGWSVIDNALEKNPEQAGSSYLHTVLYRYGSNCSVSWTQGGRYSIVTAYNPTFYNNGGLIESAYIKKYPDGRATTDYHQDTATLVKGEKVFASLSGNVHEGLFETVCAEYTRLLPFPVQAAISGYKNFKPSVIAAK